MRAGFQFVDTQPTNILVVDGVVNVDAEVCVRVNVTFWSGGVAFFEIQRKISGRLLMYPYAQVNIRNTGSSSMRD